MKPRKCPVGKRQRIAGTICKAQSGGDVRFLRFRKRRKTTWRSWLGSDGTNAENENWSMAAEGDSGEMRGSAPDSNDDRGLSEVESYRQGLDFYDRDMFEEAVDAFRRSVEIDPGNYHAWYCLGAAYDTLEAQEQAAEAYKRVVDLRGRYKAVYYNLAHAYRNLGKKKKAVRFFKLELQHDPDDYASRYMLAALEGRPPESAPTEFVRDVFDEYAEIFDSHLLDDLEYATPSLLRQVFEKLGDENPFFENVLDLGCGTGLAGAEFRDIAKRMEGVDISPLMLAKAREKNIYDMLETGDFLKIYEEKNIRYDLIVAADVFVYIGNLYPVFRLAERICAKGGYFAFSTERHEGEGYKLHDTGRFSHARDYVRKTAARFGFVPMVCEQANLRMEGGRWVEGYLYIFGRG
jgi:predicted TPR repeat methyltransferase